METRGNAGRHWLPVTSTGRRIPGNGEADAVTQGNGEMLRRPLEAATIETRPAPPSAVVTALPVPPRPEPAVDLERAALQEKLAFYETFDQLISDNVARSAELFRALYEERERLRTEADQRRADREAVAAREAEQRLTVERERMQATLMSLMDEASRMQRQVDGLIQRIAEAITEFTVWLPTEPGEPPQRAAG